MTSCIQEFFRKLLPISNYTDIEVVESHSNGTVYLLRTKDDTPFKHVLDNGERGVLNIQGRNVLVRCADTKGSRGAVEVIGK